MDQTGGTDPWDLGAPGGRAANDGGALDHRLDDLGAWAAEVRVEAVIDQRRRTAWLRRQAEEEATLAGVLVDLAEQGRAVSVQTAAGHHHRGRITIVGRDLVGLSSPEGLVALVHLGAVVAVRPQPGTPKVTGDGPLDLTTTLRRELTELHHDRARVVLTLPGAQTVVGPLDRVGLDVVSVTTDGGGQTYVPLCSVLEVSLPESG